MRPSPAAGAGSPSSPWAKTTPARAGWQTLSWPQKESGEGAGPGDRAEQIQVSQGNDFSYAVTLVSTCNKKYLFLSGLHFSLLFLSSFPWLQAIFLHGLSGATVLKKQGNLFFTRVPDLDSFRKNLILLGLWVHRLFKIMTPDLIALSLNCWGFCQFASKTTMGRDPGKVGKEQCSFFSGSCLSSPSPACCSTWSTGSPCTALVLAWLMGTNVRQKQLLCTRIVSRKLH